MSRVGKKPIPVPDKTTITYKDKKITVKGEKGVLEREIHPTVDVKIENGLINVVTEKKDRKSLALQGLTRSLINNMVTGTAQGFKRTLEINGIGYRAEVKGKVIVFNVGFSNPKNFDIPPGIDVAIDKNNVITLTGIDKEKVGHTAAAIRRIRPPECYKGKGIKYAEEHIQRKAGKTGTK